MGISAIQTAEDGFTLPTDTTWIAGPDVQAGCPTRAAPVVTIEHV